MAKPKQINLTEGGVITQEALLAYAEGRLSDAERAQMDKLLKDDPFAQDALEGLRASSSPGQIPTAITALNTQLRERTGLRERKKKGIEIHWVNYAYAAVVLGVLIGVGFIMITIFSHQHEQMAVNKPVAQESVPVAEEKKKEQALTDTTQNRATAAIKDSVSVKPGDATLTTTSSGAAASGYAYTPTKTDANTEAKPNQAKDKDADKSTTTTMSSAVSKEAKPSTTLGGETAAQLGVARIYFEASNYVDAERKYNEILASQPDNADALYFGGISSYLNGSKGLGEANFDKLMKYGLYPEGTKWYKANILLKKGKKEEAKPLLRDLINTNSIFKDRAVKQYEELYK